MRTTEAVLFPKTHVRWVPGKKQHTRAILAREHAVTARACARWGVEPHSPKAVSPKKYP